MVTPGGWHSQCPIGKTYFYYMESGEMIRQLLTAFFLFEVSELRSMTENLRLTVMTICGSEPRTVPPPADRGTAAEWPMPRTATQNDIHVVY